MNFIIDKKMPLKMQESLEKIGNIFKTTKSAVSDISVSTHPDIQIHFVSENTAFCPPELFDYYRKVIPESIELICGNSEIGSTYPECSAYNIARFSNIVICNTKFADSKILDYYKNFRIISVNQGYTKCNICFLPDGSVITEDEGIYKTLKNEGICVYKINAGAVKLKGFDYGFIGGATGIYNDKIIFCGKITEEIEDILNLKKISYIELSDDILTDFGSILTF